MKLNKVPVGKNVAVAVACVAMIGGIVGCNTKKETPPGLSATTTTNAEKEPVGVVGDTTWKDYTYEEIGVRLQLPEEYIKNRTLSADGYSEESGILRLEVDYFSPQFWEVVKEFQSKSEAELTDEVAAALQQRALQSYKKMLVIYRYPEAAVTKTPAQLTGVENATEVGRQDGYVYMAYEETNTTEGLDEASIAVYDEIKKAIPDIRAQIKLIPIKTVEEISSQIPAFSAEDIDGKPVTNDVFKGHKVTMINFWGTFCGPCITEMPDLGKLGKSMPEGSQLIGIVTDVNGNENLQLAKDILTKADATFLNIVPDGGLQSYLRTISAVPTTIFVDENGKVLGEPLVGVQPEETYRTTVMGYLK